MRSFSFFLVVSILAMEDTHVSIWTHGDEFHKSVLSPVLTLIAHFFSTCIAVML